MGAPAIVRASNLMALSPVPEQAYQPLSNCTVVGVVLYKDSLILPKKERNDPDFCKNVWLETVRHDDGHEIYVSALTDKPFRLATASAGHTSAFAT